VALHRTTLSAGAALLMCLIWAVPAQAGFVPALGSPFQTDSSPAPLALGDADRNGTVDVVGGRLQLLRGDGSGRLREALRIAASGTLNGLASGDVTGDGRIDYVAIIDGTPDELVVFGSNAGGGYTPAVADPDVGSSAAVSLGDLNRDGSLDLVVTEAGSSDELISLLNLGGGLYLREDQSADADLAAAVELADLTGDGWLDALVGTEGPEVALLVNERDGTFEPGAVTGTGASAPASAVETADFDGDRRLDVAATAGASGVAVLRATGAGGLTRLGPLRSTGTGAPTDLSVGDVNSDGRADLAASVTGARVAVLLGDGRGGLIPAPGSPAAPGTAAGDPIDQVEIADMNRDNQLDLVTANRFGSTSVLLNADTGFLSPSPSAVDFGTMPARSEVRRRTIVMRSTRGRIRMTRLDFHGSRAFSVAAGGCIGRTLLVGQSCSMTVTFTPPRRAGWTDALISLDSNAPAIVVPLTAKPRPPVVSRLRLRPRPVLAGKRMFLRYRLSEGARVRVRTQQGSPGRRAAGRCTTPRGSNARRRRCTIWRTVTVTSGRRDAGASLMRLRARAQRRALAPGLHRLSVSAADRFRNRSKERFVKFRVAPPRRAG